jgi:8-amino-3,8-dideoxy-alpha-D-manno-octulosonate transaminase
VYDKCDAFSDHGHDHLGVDRGADLHPFLGYNFRISELHAAVGLAQVRKLDTFLAIQRKHHSILKNALATIPEISFRTIPDPEGDSCTFLTWFLPTPELTRAVVEEMKTQGILAGSFYYFDNNWHYIRKWDHLKNASTLYLLTESQQAALHHLQQQDFSASDAVISRSVSTSISIGWTEDQVKEKAAKMVAAIQKVLHSSSITA